MRLGFLFLVSLACATIIFSPPVIGAEPTYYDKEFLLIDTDISSRIDLIETGGNPLADYVIADLFFHPINDLRMDILSIDTTPPSKTLDSRLRFTWLSPDKKTLDFSVKTKLKTKTVYARIPSKVIFPPAFVPPEAAIYLSETPTVDFKNPTVAQVAKELARGESDSYIFASKALTWVRETISYNLSTITAKASKPASWVIQNKQGVCDELTNLFIAILRSRGIPARFVSGLSYTNSPEASERWGPHGWAEAYFPGYGWVPFDPTYGQSGWIDPTHIKLKEGLDATEPSTTYEWRATDVKLGIHPLQLTATVSSVGPSLKLPVKLSIEPARRSVSLGSHNVITAKITNLDNSYINLDLNLGKTEGITVLGNPRKDITLRPLEKTTTSWIIKVDDVLSPDFTYTFPISVYTQRNLSADSFFNSSSKESMLNLPDATAILLGHQAQGTSIPQPSCTPSTKTPQKDRPFTITCSVTPPSEQALPESLICADGTCSSIPATTTPQTATIESVKHTPGNQETLITLSTANQTTYTSVLTTVLDSPKLTIHNASAPDYVGYDQTFTLTVKVRRESLAMPRVATLTVQIPGVSTSWPIQEAQENSFSITMRGSDVAGSGGVDLILQYEDENGTVVNEKTRVNVSLSDLSAWQSLKMLFTRLSVSIHNHLGKTF